MLTKRWTILPYLKSEAENLKSALNINVQLCQILVSRGFKNFESARSFFRPSLSDLHDPFLMKDMNKAVQRTTKAISQGEKILVFGDYDVDGTTAVAIVYDFLSQVYDSKKMEYYIPDRYREGYGVSRIGIDYAAANGFTLIICLDCGVKSVDLIAYARTLGIDFIVCDHHLPGETLPEAVAILNAKQEGCEYPYKELCGCGVGYKLITALCKQLGIDENIPRGYLDLVATAIAADIVPITGENRILAYHGLKKINDEPTIGLKVLAGLAGLEKALTISNVVFVIAPRVNAAGRMGDAKNAVKLLIEKTEKNALEFAKTLHKDNTDRKDADSTITAHALAMLDELEGTKEMTTTVVYNEQWHKGVVGIVASRLTEHYYRPTIVLTHNNNVITGSARSVAGFNLYEAIYACREYLLAYGGHFAAAGLSLNPEHLEPFKKKFEEVVSLTIDRNLLVPEIVIDAEIKFSDITPGFYNIINQMEPFGPGNMRPVFISRQVTSTPYTRLLKEQHIKFVLQQDNIVLNGIAFSMPDKFNLTQQNKNLDIVFTLDENEWNGTTTLQLKIIDFRISE